MELFIMNSDKTINELLIEQKNLLKRTTGYMAPYFLVETHSKSRGNTNLTSSILHQFNTKSVERFSELTRQDLLEEDRRLFKKLNLENKSNRIARLEDYINKSFSYAELISTLLYLRYEKDLDLYNCSIYLNEKNYNLVIDTIPYYPRYKNGVMHIHNIPVLTDKDHGNSKCLSSLIHILNGTMKAKIYNDSVTSNVVNKELTIDSYRAVVADLKPYKFFTIKV